MVIENKEEIQALININCRMLTIANLAAGYKNNAKAVKVCAKLVKIEMKELKNSSSTSYERREILHRYTELAEIMKKLTRSSTSGAANKVMDDLRLLIEKTQEIISKLNEELNPLSENVRKLAESIDCAANIISEKIGNGAQKLSEKVGEIKKKILNNDEDN